MHGQIDGAKFTLYRPSPPIKVISAHGGLATIKIIFTEMKERTEMCGVDPIRGSDKNLLFINLW